MRFLLRGLTGGLLAVGVAALATHPADLAAQAKKDPAKKDPTPAAKKDDKGKPDDSKDRVVGISTCDGLSLNAYWFQGNNLDKNPPDAVLMFPAPGNKVTDSWIALARALGEKNFSVLLMDWRGCGMNAPDTAGQRVIAEKELFWKEPYNQRLLKPNMKSIEDKGLDYKLLRNKVDGTWRYTDFMMNDLLAARYYLDKQNDNRKCNSGRIWIVTEKDGGEVALGFMASEWGRNSIYQKTGNLFDTNTQYRSAGKDFIGLTCLSFAGGNATGRAFYNNAIYKLLSGQQQKEALDYFEHRLAMVMVFGKKEGNSGSRGAFSVVKAGGDDDALKKNFKYLREVDNSKLAGAVSGIGLIDPMDSFGAKADIVKVMPEIQKVLPTNKDPFDRDANKVTVIPRLEPLVLGRR